MCKNLRGQTGRAIYREPFVPLLIQAVIASAEIVRKNWQQPIGGIAAKNDGTIVTKVDLASQAAADAYLRTSGLERWYEEGGSSEVTGTKFKILLDPLDGTTAFASGATTSTTCAALYDTDQNRVTACVVAEPAGSRLWVAVEGMGTWRCQMAVDPQDVKSLLDRAERCVISGAALSPKSIVYTDCTRGFIKSGYPVVPDEVWATFLAKLFRFSRFQNLGTNCGHHALVANGGHGVVAAITTAIGGPWDVAPVLLVLEAGGAARAISTANGKLAEIDPLRVGDYGYLVSGNSPETVDQLMDLLAGHLITSGIVIN